MKPADLQANPPLQAWPRGSRPLKLAFILSRLSLYGTPRQTLQLARRLDPDKYQIELWIMTGIIEPAPEVRAWNIHPHRLSTSTRRGLGAVLGLARRIMVSRPDLLVPMDPMPNIWARLLGRLLRVPLIIGNCRIGSPKRQHEQWLWPLADHIICNTRAVRESLIGDYKVPGQNITVIRNGVDTDYFQPPPVKPNGPPVLVCLARLHKDKDPHTLLRAFHLVQETFPEATLWMVGAGPLDSPLHAWVKENLPENCVQFFGAQADVRPFLQQASLFVLSSLSNASEAMPNAVLEAMSCGLPVVATRAGGISEVVIEGETGLLVQEKNPPALGQAICRLLADPGSLMAMGQAGRRRAVAEFSFDLMVRRHEEIYDRLIEGKRGRAFGGRNPRAR